jgi:hypothetical protein
MDCFGKLEQVFPMGENGLRTSPPECMKCPMAKPCLQAAMKELEGLQFEEDRIDRAYECGMIGRLERWSQKKYIRRKMEEQAKARRRGRPKADSG